LIVLGVLFPQNIIVPIPIKLSIYTQHYCPSMGKGMYGMNVHKAVVANKEKNRNTFHYVNEHYDEGGCISKKSNLKWK
jgi:phosphoribosylglycinamide formyltransferase-1